MALPLAMALGLTVARTAAGQAVKRYGATALAAGSKYASKAATKGKELADDAVGAAKSYFKKPEAPSKPDFVVDSAGTVSRAGQAVPKPSAGGSIKVDSSGTARLPNYPLATQGSRAVTVTGKKTIDPKYAATPSKLKDMVGKAATITSTAQLAGSSQKAEAPTVDTSEVADTPEVKPAASVKVLGNGRTTRVGTGSTKKVEAEPEKAPAAVVSSQNNSVSVQGSGNMDIPEHEQMRPDPQFDAEIKNFEGFKADGGDAKDIAGFNEWKKIKAQGLNFVRDGSGKAVRTGTGGFWTSRY
jgi:hypothetical protein